MRPQLGFGELAHSLPQELLIVVEAHVHGLLGLWPIVSFDMRLARLLLFGAALLSTASNAWADATVFIGTATSPSNRTTRGFTLGAGLLIVAFEFEYGDTVEDLPDAAPSLRTGMGNVLIQTPFAIAGFQPYFTTGAGVYWESLGGLSETNFGINNGGGVKISLVGPLRARVDYRVFSLRGAPIEDTVQRLYVGLNLKF